MYWQNCVLGWFLKRVLSIAMEGTIQNRNQKGGEKKGILEVMSGRSRPREKCDNEEDRNQRDCDWVFCRCAFCLKQTDLLSAIDFRHANAHPDGSVFFGHATAHPELMENSLLSCYGDF